MGTLEKSPSVADPGNVAFPREPFSPFERSEFFVLVEKYEMRVRLVSDVRGG
jgi:hypothetical protein